MEVAVDASSAVTPTRAELVAAACAGDRSAFGRLVEPSLVPALGASILITRSHADGHDAVQDALLTAWLGLDQIRDPDAFPGWFRTLVVRSALRVARKRGQVVELAVLPEPESVDDGLERSVDRRLLRRAFDRVSPHDRALLTLRYLWDLPVSEVGVALSIPEGTVKSRTHAAIGRLRAAFDAEARR